MKKYNQFIKEKYEDIDPYGEENWNEDISTDYLNSVVDYLDINGKLKKSIGDNWSIYFKKDDEDYKIYNLEGRVFLRILSGEYDVDDIELEDSDWVTIRLAIQRLNNKIAYKKFTNESHYEDIDPYGEEDWDNENELKKGDKVVCLKNFQNKLWHDGGIYEILKVLGDYFILTTDDKNIKYRMIHSDSFVGTFKKINLNENHIKETLI